VRLLERNHLCEEFFAREAPRLAQASREMADRFLRGGRLLAFGRGPYATDAQHVSVEFVHPVIVGKRALPALDLSIAFRPWLEAILSVDDMAMAFRRARSRRAMTFALPGTQGDYAVAAHTQRPFIHQEIVEMLYHVLWETVHVFFEHRELGRSGRIDTPEGARRRTASRADGRGAGGNHRRHGASHLAMR
jgi:D-sedoheptulose 7-phosphate isomerase